MPLHPEAASVPAGTRTGRLQLQPLRESDTARDYDAVMASASQLRAWSQSDWPAPGFTLEENRADLVRHEHEHVEGVAYTFTVLDPAGERCLGCVYVRPPDPALAPRFAGAAHVADVWFWARTDMLSQDLDAHLLETLRAWLARDWAFDRVVFSVASGDTRRVELLARAGLTEHAPYTRADGRTCRLFE